MSKKDDGLRDNLINEVRFLLHQGKQRNEIVGLLSAKGNSPNFVNELIDYTYQQQNMNKSNYHSDSNSTLPENNVQNNGDIVKVEHTHKLSGGTLFFISFFFIILFGSGLFLFLSQKDGDSYLLDYEVQLTKNSFNAGDEVEFDTRYSNMGSKGSYDVFTKYQVINAKQEVIMEWEDTKAVSNVQNYYIHNTIPENTLAGKYYVYSEVSYGNNQKATARTLYFDLMSTTEENTSLPIDTSDDNPEDEPEEPLTDDNTSINQTDEDNTTEDEPIKDEPVKSDEPSDDDPRYSDDPQELALAIIAEAKTYAISNPQEAANLCFNLTEKKLIDNCFQQLAKASTNYNFCKEIKESAAKDFCYISYVLDMGDYEKCDYIISEKTKKSCRILNPDYKGE